MAIQASQMAVRVTEMAFANGEYSFYALRFAVGLAEAGFFPGAILYLSFWFPARRRTGVTAIFMAAVPLSNMFSAPISGAIMEMTGFLGLKGWQRLFLLEAAPTVLLGAISYFYLGDKNDRRGASGALLP
jgi:MFS transporter, ACS family, tartrate transporter